MPAKTNDLFLFLANKNRTTPKFNEREFLDYIRDYLRKSPESMTFSELEEAYDMYLGIYE